MTKKQCPLGEACDLTTAWMAGRQFAIDRYRKETNPIIEAKDAEIERLRSELATCEKYRDAYAECDRIGTQAVRDIEAKLENLIGGAETVLEVWDHHMRDVVVPATLNDAIEELRADVAEAKGDKP